MFGSRGRPADAMAEARTAARRAVALADDAPEARIAMGLVELYADWDWAGARAELEAAVQLDPGNPEAHFYLAHALGAAARLDEAIAAARRAQELDPFSPLIRHYVGRFFYYRRDHDAAIREHDAAVELDPGYPWSALFLSVAFEQLGRYDPAARHRQRATSPMGVAPEQVQELGAVYAAGGYPELLRYRAAELAGSAQ